LCESARRRRCGSETGRREHLVLGEPERTYREHTPVQVEGPAPFSFGGGPSSFRGAAYARSHPSAVSAPSSAVSAPSSAGPPERVPPSADPRNLRKRPRPRKFPFYWRFV